MERALYGWVVVLCAFTLMLVGFGAAYSFAAFFRAFESEFGASRAHVSLVFSLCAFLYFLLGAPGGMLADRFGTRVVALAGVVCLAAGLAAASFARSIEVLYATYSIGLGIGIGLTYVPSVGAVQPWFDRQRVLASGIAVAGIGAGNLLGPPLAAWWIGAFGWRGAYLVMAACTLVLGGAAAAAIRNRPAGQARATAGIALRAALRTRNFWVLYVSLALTGFGVFVPLVHLGPYATDAGHPESFGVLLVSLIGLGSLAGRFAVGSFAERFGRMRSLSLMYVGMAAMLLLWWGSTGALALSIMAVGFGVAYGGFVATFPTVVMDLFGPRSVAGIIGCIYTAAGVGTLFGPPAAGAAFDATGSYAGIIAAAALLNLVAAAASAALLRPREG
ncbi:MAG TPA: MFS transporter [Burkholderiales bacterium]|nr:MFS transporter [Burkholderiales bacterium]